MKIRLFSFIIVLLKGEVVSEITISQAIQHSPASIQMDCLDRSGGAQLGALRGPMVVNVWGSWCWPMYEKRCQSCALSMTRHRGEIQLIGVAC
jgi:hypothetical protein